MLFCLADFSLSPIYIYIVLIQEAGLFEESSVIIRILQRNSRKHQSTSMIGLSYPGFIFPIPNADEYNDFVTAFPLSSSIKRRFSTSNSSKSLQNAAQPERPNRTGVMKRLRLLVDERIHLKRGYVSLQRG